MSALRSVLWSDSSHQEYSLVILLFSEVRCLFGYPFDNSGKGSQRVPHHQLLKPLPSLPLSPMLTLDCRKLTLAGL